jgi:hypothetical protein
MQFDCQNVVTVEDTKYIRVKEKGIEYKLYVCLFHKNFNFLGTSQKEEKQ